MERSRFGEARIMGIPKEHRAGMSASDPCREHGIGDETFCDWRRGSGGMAVADARRPKALGAENAKLKKMLAEQMLHVATLEEIPGKSFQGPSALQGGGLGHETEGRRAAADLRPWGSTRACIHCPAGHCASNVPKGGDDRPARRTSTCVCDRRSCPANGGGSATDGCIS